jgi:hypothetical protein
MRITRELLLKLAKDTVQQRVKTDRSLVAALLTGSTLKDDPFLGGTTDIDLVYVVNMAPPTPREIVRLSNEVHLDISYHELMEFEPARKLRRDSSLGYLLYDPHLLYESQRFFEYTQAIVRAGFDEPENRLLRARQHSTPARQKWIHMALGTGDKPADLLEYFYTVYHAANAIAMLCGEPLPERRMLINFARYAEGIERNDLNDDLLELIGGFDVISADMLAMLPEWQKTFNAAASDGGSIAINPARRAYYESCIEALLHTDRPAVATWPLIHTWTQAAAVLPGYAPEVTAWKAAMTQFNLSFEGLEQKVQLLDKYLDKVEEMLDAFAADNGIEE